MTYTKTLATLIAAAAGCGMCGAAEPNPLSVSPAGDGATHQWHIHAVDKITFEGADMVVTHADGTDTLPVAAIGEMRFDREYDATADIADALADGLDIAIAARVLTATAAPDVPVTITVYDTTGMMRATAASVGAASVDFNAMPAGIYIVKVNDKTLKLKN